MSLDIPTLAIVAFLIGIGLSLGFTLLGLTLRKQRVLRVWAAGFWMGTVGAVFLGLRGHVPEWISVLGGNGAIALSGALMLKGVALHVGRRLPWSGPLGFVAVYVVLIAWFEFFQPDLVTRMNLYSVQSAGWDVGTIWLLLRYGQRDIRLSCRIAATVFLLDALFYLARPFLPLGVGVGQDFMRAGAPMVATYLVGIMLALGWNLAFILLVTERLVVDLNRQARTDGLTGLFNRGALIEEGRAALARCRAHRLPFTLLMFDLDHFKRINDTWGHDAGDAVLRHFTDVVRADSDAFENVFSRYGGEEFVLALPGTTLADGMALARRIRGSLAMAPAFFAQHTIAVTTSTGVASAEVGMGFEQVVATADDALYRAKTDGRDCVVSLGVERV
jgi:diguanylate cyclase (GGDEF)-like protein